MKKMWIALCLLSVLSFFVFAGCNHKNKEEQISIENKQEQTVTEEIVEEVKLEGTEVFYDNSEGRILSFGERKEGPYYEITQLPFPTFWGGAAYSIITPEGDLYLIDGGFKGEDGTRLKTYIKEHGGKVKGWFLTHPHVDHIGAFLDVVNSYRQEGEEQIPIENVYYSPFTSHFFEKEEDLEIYLVLNNPEANLFFEFRDLMEETKNRIHYIPLLPKDVLQLGELTLECFSSFDANRKDVNANSLVFSISYQDFSFLFTGDMTEHTLEDMKKNFGLDAKIWDCTVLQIPHHGYMAGIATDALYHATKPQYVFLDCTDYEYRNNSVKIVDHVKMIEGLNIPVIKRFEASKGNQIRLYAR